MCPVVHAPGRVYGVLLGARGPIAIAGPAPDVLWLSSVDLYVVRAALESTVAAVGAALHDEVGCTGPVDANVAAAVRVLGHLDCCLAV